MLDWTIPTDTWHALLERTPMPTARRDIADDADKRLSCSIYVWAQVTKGEQRYAPCPPGARSDPGRHYLTRGGSTGYAALRNTLDTHAEHLSGSCPLWWCNRLGGISGGGIDRVHAALGGGSCGGRRSIRRASR